MTAPAPEPDAHGQRPPSPFELRCYRPGDEAGIVDLFARTFDTRIGLDHWRWKYRGYPRASENVWLAVDGEDRPVFHYGGVPCRLVLADGSERPAMTTFDAMTAPEYRRRGILTAVLGEAHATWRRQGIALVLGIPNERWGSRIAALGWEPLFGLRWLIRPLRPELLLSRRLRLPVLARTRSLSRILARLWPIPAASEAITIEEVEETDEASSEMDEVGRRFASPGTASLRRDAAWVAWRFLQSPERRYRVLLARRQGAPLGYVAWRLDAGDASEPPASAGFGFIAEIVAPEDDAEVYRALLGGALRALDAAGARAVATLAVPGTAPFGWLRRHGFRFSWGEFRVHAIRLDPAIEIAELRDPQRFRIGGAEFDVI